MKVLSFFYSLDKWIEKLTAGTLVVTVLSMLLFTLLNIVLRWCSVAVFWIDPLVRHLVFLSTFLGGVIATGRGTHVGIDIITKFLENRNLHHYKQIVSIIISIISFVTLLWLVYASLLFFKVELQYGRPKFLGIHSAALVGIIPFGFSLIAYRFFNKLLIAIFNNDEEVKTC